MKSSTWDKIVGVFLIFAGFAFGLWLCLYVMLYGGIMEAITHWGTDHSAVVWGIMMVVFCPITGLPAYVLIVCGLALIDDD